MAHSEHTLLLAENWDVQLDDTGNIAVTLERPYSTAQNVANECRLFTEDAYFAQDQGIPHFAVELGHRLPLSPFRHYVREATLIVPQVAEIQEIRVDGVDGTTRTLSGSITFKPLGETESVTIDI